MVDRRAGRGGSPGRCRRGPGSAWRRRRPRRPAGPRIIAAPSRPTRSGSSPKDRSPMTGFFGLVSTSTTRREVVADAAGRELRGERRAHLGAPSPRCRPGPPRAAPARASRAPCSRATRPPSWSTATSSGSSWPGVARHRLQLAHEIGHLLGRCHVAREQDDAADPELADERLHVGRGGGPSKPTMKRCPTRADESPHLSRPAACARPRSPACRRRSSRRPASAARAAFITLPMSFGDVAPVSATAFSTAAAISSSEASSGR